MQIKTVSNLLFAAAFLKGAYAAFCQVGAYTGVGPNGCTGQNVGEASQDGQGESPCQPAGGGICLFVEDARDGQYCVGYGYATDDCSGPGQVVGCDAILNKVTSNWQSIDVVCQE